ncbi:MAG: AAA family ATPase [Edaphobacter sp.]|uniref:AAA family ATPase n=1 Tax=Edaphobacter sp. TaxID=1934404 RepID=UPI0023838D8F|nr:AAA family ATPase [Edaphobacter sp.]MDE1178396.1 AAA family ATPase [Edaphobacter sp.]
MEPRLIVITGGPGAGKTALLDELQQRGFAVAPEVAREIIREQMASGGDAVPWSNREAFARQMLVRSIGQWQQLQSAEGLVFVDRGIPDTLCYARLAGLSREMQQDAYAACCEMRYATPVFIAPAWQQIYETDMERKQSFEEAEATFERMRETYEDCSYSLKQLPLVSVGERADFVLHALAL